MDLHELSSVHRLNNFASSYKEHVERTHFDQPSIRNHAVLWTVKKIFSGVTWSKLDNNHPVMEAAKDADYYLEEGRIMKVARQSSRKINRAISKALELFSAYANSLKGSVKSYLLPDKIDNYLMSMTSPASLCAS